MQSKFDDVSLGEIFGTISTVQGDIREGYEC